MDPELSHADDILLSRPVSRGGSYVVTHVTTLRTVSFAAKADANLRGSAVLRRRKRPGRLLVLRRSLDAVDDQHLHL